MSNSGMPRVVKMAPNYKLNTNLLVASSDYHITYK